MVTKGRTINNNILTEFRKTGKTSISLVDNVDQDQVTIVLKHVVALGQTIHSELVGPGPKYGSAYYFYIYLTGRVVKAYYDTRELAVLRQSEFERVLAEYLQ